jgi:hypothetical protein
LGDRGQGEIARSPKQPQKMLKREEEREEIAK